MCCRFMNSPRPPWAAVCHSPLAIARGHRRLPHGDLGLTRRVTGSLKVFPLPSGVAVDSGLNSLPPKHSFQNVNLSTLPASLNPLTGRGGPRPRAPQSAPPLWPAASPRCSCPLPWGKPRLGLGHAPGSALCPGWARAPLADSDQASLLRLFSARTSVPQSFAPRPAQSLHAHDRGQ